MGDSNTENDGGSDTSSAARRSTLSPSGSPDGESTPHEDATLPEASWYPDPAGSAQLRWWDGTAWTEHLHDPVPPRAVEASAAVNAKDEEAPSSVSATVATSADANSPFVPTPALTSPTLATPVDPSPYLTGGIPHESTPETSLAPAGIEPAGIASAGMAPAAPPLPTRFLWLMIVLPLIQVVAFSFYDLNGVVARTMMQAFAEEPISQRIDGVWPVLNLVFIVLTVLLALADWRGLNRARLDRPFHWAWSFFGVGVYVIGRCVIVYRRTGRGLAPIWVWLGVAIFSFCLVAVKTASALAVAAHIATMYGR